MAEVQHADLTSIHRFAYVQSSDPGAVGAYKGWLDTTTNPPVLKYRNSGNSAWVTALDITTAINAVIASAPGALDTLDELAAALGDDANFATTVTNALAAKASLTGAETLTNKRMTARVGTTASSATPTPDADAHDGYTITALAEAAELQNPSGTPTSLQPLIVRIKDDGTARALTYDTQYRAVGTTLPTTTVIGKTIYLGMLWNAADSKWDVIGVAEEA